MRNADAEFESEALVHLPGILYEALEGVIGNIVDTVEIRLVVGIEIADQHVGIRISKTGGVGVAAADADGALSIGIVRLRVADVLPEDAGLDGVRYAHTFETVSLALGSHLSA